MRTLILSAVTVLVFLTIAAGLPLQRNFFTVNTAPVVQTTAGSNCYVTFTQAGQTRTYRVDVPTNGAAGASFGVDVGTNIYAGTNGTVVTLNVPSQTNGFTSIVYSNSGDYMLSTNGYAATPTFYGITTITGAVPVISIIKVSGGEVDLQINGSTNLAVNSGVAATEFLGAGTNITSLNATNLLGTATNNTTGSAGRLSGGATNQVYAFGSTAGWTGTPGMSNIVLSGGITFAKDITWHIGASASANRPGTVWAQDLNASRDVIATSSTWIGGHAQLTSPNVNELQIHNAYAGANFARVIVSNLCSTDIIIATNGVMQLIKPSFTTNFTCTTNLQFYCCNGTNQVITLPFASNVVGRIFRFSSTNGYSLVTITNSGDGATIRDGTSLSITSIGIAPVDLISDGANWWLSSKQKTILPNAQFSCSTNLSLASANVAYPVTYNSTDWNNSQGISLVVGTNASGYASKIRIANQGQYEFTPSLMYQSGGATHTFRMWFRQNDTNIVNSCTAQKVSAGDITVITVPFIVNVTKQTDFELWVESDSTAGGSDTVLAQAASGNYPASPGTIMPVKRISDSWP